MARVSSAVQVIDNILAYAHIDNHDTLDSYAQRIVFGDKCWSVFLFDLDVCFGWFLNGFRWFSIDFGKTFEAKIDRRT